MERLGTSQLRGIRTSFPSSRAGKASFSGTKPIPRLLSISGSIKSEVVTSMSGSKSIPWAMKKSLYSW